MKFNVNRKEIHQAVQNIIGVVPVKTTIPIKNGKNLKNYFFMTIKEDAKIAPASKKLLPGFETFGEIINYKLEHLDSVEAASKLKNTLDIMKIHTMKKDELIPK